MKGPGRASIIAGYRETQRTARERAFERGLAGGRLGEAVSTEHASKLADGFVRRVLDHALAVDEKIAQLNGTWPHTVLTFQARVRAEVNDRTALLRRYVAACRGDTEGTSLAVIEPCPRD